MREWRHSKADGQENGREDNEDEDENDGDDNDDDDIDDDDDDVASIDAIIDRRYLFITDEDVNDHNDDNDNNLNDDNNDNNEKANNNHWKKIKFTLIQYWWE